MTVLTYGICPHCDLKMIKLYSGRVGCAVHGAVDVKGDVVGHSFHGNQWTGGRGGGDKPQPASTLPKDSRVAIKVSDVNEAARLLGEGHKIELQQPRQVCVLLDKLAAIAKEAEAAGDKSKKTYNLCDITVPGTNLFCADAKVPSRYEMPQLGGHPPAGSKADALQHIDKGPNKPYEVDLTAGFMKHLQGLGYDIKQTTEQAAYLRATQNELKGVQVAQMMGALRAGKSLGNGAILTSKDNYIIDGHHRWAAEVGLDSEDGHLGNGHTMAIQRVNAPIMDLINLAVTYADSMGMPRVSGKRYLDPGCGC